ncbi:Cdk activating kinase (CAK)/RNA polymerase II transcription initiation [Handroanthus impetiginosus]|uniref:Cdk activating kinase (CAK)/RNA polymerase II transcription initiation n=1 Tax=Handroanthus impetiginosus TaxID=429701 RepID=A0A2G9I4H3_9LAMI|nr:Cdk activating kinase (CAK)/RNA polymerase II transcription initiation [Handroanthus impetiginosus]
MDPQSVRFMAWEICILRRLDHPNVMKLEALVTSRISGSLYLVFEYMEHDLAGLLASPRVKFTEAQVHICFTHLLVPKHCHSRGVLHRDIKGSNLLVDNKGNLKIGDFGLATSFEPGQEQALTSHVVTLWYRAPELLLGETQYEVAIDMWSAGCILAELFAGKPIMPGRTECVYKHRVADAFKDFPSSALALIEVLLSIDPQFFTSNPLPCDPSSLPKYLPSKEFDAKLQEETRRRKAERSKGNGTECARSNSRKSKTDL